mmetsp:Transcript_9503/g.26259  ORF Transcript_9503/g.26259 Transcript_9503/m.26259 type:complete len:100 (-) Transcript_9503:111-410(-)
MFARCRAHEPLPLQSEEPFGGPRPLQGLAAVYWWLQEAGMFNVVYCLALVYFVPHALSPKASSNTMAHVGFRISVIVRCELARSFAFDGQISQMSTTTL